MSAPRSTPSIAVLGAGLSGMCMGIALRDAGITNFRIFEKADRVGGTWRENSYPGVACDVPSHLYSYSFELNPDWSRTFSPGAEIQEYCERVARKYELGAHLVLGAEVTSVAFQGGSWRIWLASGEEHCADVVVSALGGLHEPHVPRFEGLDRFRGMHFHSARWNHAHDLRGRRVAVVGSAASAVQLVPQIAPQVEQLYVFQRTPNWIVPRRDRAYSARIRSWFRRHPFLARLHRWSIYLLLELRFPMFLKGSRMSRAVKRMCRAHLAAQVPDTDLRRKLTPDYPPGCKRLLVSDDFYPSLLRENVELVTTPIARIDADAIVTMTGEAHRVDTIVFATGFEPFNMLASVQVTGMGGRSLGDVWKGGIQAHRTVAVPGFPNFFLLLGPNSGLGHNSVIVMIEAQVRYVLQCIRALAASGRRYLSPRAAIAQQFDASLQRDMERTIWRSSCKSWYQDASGRVFTLWPYTTLRYLWQMRRLELEEYEHLPDVTQGAAADQEREPRPWPV